MVRFSLEDLPEVFLSTDEISRAVSQAARAGAVRKLGPRLYTRNTSDTPEAVVRRNLWQVVGMVCPNSVVGYRTALEARPTPGGTVFLSGAYERRVELPGLRIRQMKAPGRLEGDTRFVQSLWLASQARALLECLRVRRVRGAESPSLPREEIEAKLERMVRHGGEREANAIRDAARRIAPALDAEDAFAELDALLGALLGTRTAALTTPAARARAGGEPYDPGRVELFQKLHAELAAWTVRPRPDRVRAGNAFKNIAFADAYFSNFIEGTEFEVEEAVGIVFENRIPRARPQDAHDILGTFRLVASAEEMKRSAAAPDATFDDFVATLRRRHAEIMGGRPEKRPGEFKTEVNRAGLTVFVEPELVMGTLRQGHAVLRSLPEPFKRAAFMMFVVSEVHPFDDGNGRLARVMMNAELIAGRQRRILIPTAYRDDYLLALRALSRRAVAEPLVRMMDYAQAFSAAIDFSNLRAALAMLEKCRAFESDAEARLRMPV